MQSLLGLLWATAYRDPAWIKATWFGNDLVTLLVAAPLMSISHRMAVAGSVRAELVRLGMIGYAVYNYAFYLFGAALNAFLPLYVITTGVAIVTLASSIAGIDSIAVAQPVRPTARLRLVGGYLMFVACGLSLVWIGMWGPTCSRGHRHPSNRRRSRSLQHSI